MGRFFGPFVCLAFAALSSVAHAHHSWGSYHWGRTSNPFTLKLGNNVSTTWKSYLDQASSDWSQSSVLNTEVVTGGTRPKTCKPTAGRVEVCSERYGYNGWLGIAQIWISGGHITQAITKLNDHYFNAGKYNTPEWRALVTCQEIGHTFGLDHQDENFSNANMGTCMDYTSSPAGNEHPDSHDYEQLATIYDHLDSTTSASQTSQRDAAPPAMNDIDFEGPGQWGKLVRSTHGGRLQRYELDFGGGHKIFTFVIWADEEHRGRGQPR